MSPLDSYLNAAGVSTPKQAAAATALDAYFDATGVGSAKTASADDPALSAYLAGFAKQADWADFKPMDALSDAWNATTGAVSSAAHSVADAGRSIGQAGLNIGDHLLGGVQTVGNGLAAVPRAVGAASGSILGGGSLRDAGNAMNDYALAPIDASSQRMLHGSPGAPAAPAPTSIAPAPAPAPAALASASSPSGQPMGMLTATLPSKPAAPALLPGFAPEIAGTNPPALVSALAPAASGPTVTTNGTPTPGLATPPAPAAPAASVAAPATPPTATGAVTADHLAQFKKQTGSTYNPHSIADRMAMMGFQRGMTGNQAQQYSSLANRRQISPNAGQAGTNTAMLGALDKSPTAFHVPEIRPGSAPASPTKSPALTAAR